MDMLPIITIPVLTIAVAWFKPLLKKWVPGNLCAVCTAISFSWLLLLALLVAGFEIPPLSPGILLGMSLVGLMYKLEPIFKQKQLGHFWMIRILMLTGGYASVLFLLQSHWNKFVLSASITFLGIIIVTFLMQGTTHEDVLNEAKNDKEKTLRKRLEDCC